MCDGKIMSDGLWVDTAGLSKCDIIIHIRAPKNLNVKVSSKQIKNSSLLASLSYIHCTVSINL